VGSRRGGVGDLRTCFGGGAGEGEGVTLTLLEALLRDRRQFLLGERRAERDLDRLLVFFASFPPPPFLLPGDADGEPEEAAFCFLGLLAFSRDRLRRRPRERLLEAAVIYSSG